MSQFLVSTPTHKVTDLTVLLAHGAGSFMDSEFMTFFATGLASQGVTVVRFEFPYCQQRRLSGKMRPPNPVPVLVDSFKDVIDEWGGPSECIAAGKSLGGRVASLMLAQTYARGAISLGYPFHPPKKPNKLRNEHWPSIVNPWLVIQGTRDPFGSKEEVAQYTLPEPCVVHWLADGDHDFKPRVRSGFTQHELWQNSIDEMVQFIVNLEG